MQAYIRLRMRTLGQKSSGLDHETSGLMIHCYPTVERMRAILLLIVLAAWRFSSEAEDTNTIAVSGWSKPVGTFHGHTLRARFVLAHVYSPAFGGPFPETALYLEFKNVSGAIGSPTRIHFDPWQLRCELRDANGRAKTVGGAGSGSGPGACWLTLPYDSSIRVRANMYAYGAPRGDGLLLQLFNGGWVISKGDTNDYFLSGSFTVAPLTNNISDFEVTRSIWSGTLELPETTIYEGRPSGRVTKGLSR